MRGAPMVDTRAGTLILETGSGWPIRGYDTPEFEFMTR